MTVRIEPVHSLEAIAAAAAAFANRVKAIPEVRAVVLDVGDSEPRVTTYLERRDTQVRQRVYEAEMESHAASGPLGIDFRVRSLDNPGCSVPDGATAGLRVIFRRP